MGIKKEGSLMVTDAREETAHMEEKTIDGVVGNDKSGGNHDEESTYNFNGRNGLVEKPDGENDCSDRFERSEDSGRGGSDKLDCSGGACKRYDSGYDSKRSQTQPAGRTSRKSETYRGNGDNYEIKERSP